MTREVEDPVDAEPETVTEEVIVRRRRRLRPILLGLLVLVLLGLLFLWLDRAPLTSHFIHKELERRGVRATYKVAAIGIGAERLENVVIGDPADPDLTARSVEVRLSWGFRKPRVSLITARGVRLHGRIVGGKLKLGDVDKLLPPPSGKPFSLPNAQVDLADAAIRLETPAGRIGIGLEGRGNLSDGFRGRMAAVGHRLALGGCRIDEGRGWWTVAVDQLRPHFTGPAQLQSLACGTRLAASGLHLDLDTGLAPALDGWTGKSGVTASSISSGANQLHGVAGSLDFAGNAARTRGRLALAAASVRAGDFAAGRTSLQGDYDAAPNARRFTYTGAINAAGVSGGRAALAPVAAALASAGATPVGPVTKAWAAALSNALAGGVDASAGLAIAEGPDGGSVRITRLDAAGRSGARLSFAGALLYPWPGGAAQLDGDLALRGGGLPDARFSLRRSAGGAIEGTGRIAPYAAGGARLALDEIRFSAEPGGATLVQTVATIDGPFSVGGVNGLILPIAARIDAGGGLTIGQGCQNLRFAALRVSSLRLGPAAFTLCPTGRALAWKAPGGALQGGARLRGARFAGTLGASPVSIAAADLRVGLAGPVFAATSVALRLGAGDRINRLDIASLSGRFGGAGIAGAYAGLSGKLAAVPLLVDQGQGHWQFARGALAADGRVRVSDAVAPARFTPLVTDDFRLALAGNKVSAHGWLKEPATGTRIAEAHIAHSLATGAGGATFDVPGVTFDEHFQPEQLTRLTTGIVALVRGTVKGQAEIGWDSHGTTSTGTFSTEDMNLAASFGPVEGITTTVHFTDLLGLVTAPGQLAEVKAIHTGIDVFDGRIRYRLLPDLRVEVEGASWPFAGGTLALDQTILDFSQPSAKRLTFHVTGMDGARFIEQMQFSNISGTGTFDGVVPMLFDERGGRIIGGRLVAREGGGNLSYIGELTDKQLGAYGKLAFDALKSLRYSRLILDLNGALDGEFVAGVKLDGIARNPSATAAPSGGISGLVVARALNQLAEIPFKFNISIRGPFRAIIGTARSLEDPTNLIQSVLPQMLQDKPTTTHVQPQPDVQPQESETVP